MPDGEFQTRQPAERRRAGLVAHLIDIALALLLTGLFFTWFGHYHAPFANPYGPVRWQSLAMVPVLFWVDLRVLGGALANPVFVTVAALPPLLIGAFVAIVNSRFPRWARIVLHAIACLVFVVGTILVVALLNIRIF